MNTPKTSGPLQPATAKRGNGKPNPVEVATREAMPKPRPRIETTLSIKLVDGNLDLLDGDYTDQLPRRINTQLGGDHRKLARVGLRRLYKSTRDNCVMESGKVVMLSHEAVIWMLEQIAKT